MVIIFSCILIHLEKKFKANKKILRDKVVNNNYFSKNNKNLEKFYFWENIFFKVTNLKFGEYFSQKEDYGHIKLSKNKYL